MNSMKNQKGEAAYVIVGGFVVLLIAGVIILGALWNPILGPWIQERKGTANLRQAEQERRILVEQATAERDAARLRAEAIAIVGEAAQKYPEYRQQEFIGAFAEAVQSDAINQIIYVPTEGNIPITEAGRMAN